MGGPVASTILPDVASRGIRQGHIGEVIGSRSEIRSFDDIGVTKVAAPPAAPKRDSRKA